jgi:spore coat assembly protein
MNELKVGDIVARKSYGCDVCFKVVDIEDKDVKKMVTLKGIIYRLEADAPASDLEIQSRDHKFSKNT